MLVCLELLTRLLGLAPALPASFGEFEADDVLPFRMRANTVKREGGWPNEDEFDFEVRTNSVGFRDVEHGLAKPEGVFRILGLGDSFTMGAGARFEDTYLYRLERMLAADPRIGSRVEIIKAGQPRYWPEAERLLLEVLGVEFEPDLILVGFTPNDVTDTFIGASYLGVREGYLVSREAYQLGDTLTRLYVRSHVARIVLRAHLDRSLASHGRGVVAQTRFGQIFREGGHHEADWLAVEREFETMTEIAREIGASIAFVHIPFRVPDPKSAYPGQRLARWGARQGVPVIDAYAAMARAARTEKLYWEKDIHCNANGYRVIAEMLHAQLFEQGLVPGS